MNSSKINTNAATDALSDIPSVLEEVVMEVDYLVPRTWGEIEDFWPDVETADVVAEALKKLVELANAVDNLTAELEKVNHHLGALRRIAETVESTESTNVRMARITDILEDL